MKMRLFVRSDTEPEIEITNNLYWFEENGVESFEGNGFYEKWYFRAEIDVESEHGDIVCATGAME